MKEIIKTIVEKLFCKHNWEIVKTTSYQDCNRHLLVCTKCGKTKRITL